MKSLVFLIFVSSLGWAQKSPQNYCHYEAFTKYIQELNNLNKYDQAYDELINYHHSCDIKVRDRYRLWRDLAWTSYKRRDFATCLKVVDLEKRFRIDNNPLDFTLNPVEIYKMSPPRDATRPLREIEILCRNAAQTSPPAVKIDKDSPQQGLGATVCYLPIQTCEPQDDGTCKYPCAAVSVKGTFVSIAADETTVRQFCKMKGKDFVSVKGSAHSRTDMVYIDQKGKITVKLNTPQDEPMVFDLRCRTKSLSKNLGQMAP